jgi:hypothetical protein
MPRLLAVKPALFAALSAALIGIGASVLSASPASASSLTMGCNIQPSANDVFSSVCGTTYAAGTYSVDYYVQGTIGGETYAWTPPAGKPIVAGCTSTSASCVITTSAHQDMELTGSVVVTQDGPQYDFSATAILDAVCGPEFC